MGKKILRQISRSTRLSIHDFLSTATFYIAIAVVILSILALETSFLYLILIVPFITYIFLWQFVNKKGEDDE